MRTKSAIDYLPPWLHNPAPRALCAALDRGDTLLVPERFLLMASIAERLVAVARKVGAPVIVIEEWRFPGAQIATRERVDA